MPSERQRLVRDVVARALPELCIEPGKLGLMKLCVFMDRTKQSMYHAFFKSNSISADTARELIERSNGRLTANDLLPFIK